MITLVFRRPGVALPEKPIPQSYRDVRKADETDIFEIDDRYIFYGNRNATAWAEYEKEIKVPVDCQRTGVEAMPHRVTR
jgi:hypothetical protein